MSGDNRQMLTTTIGAFPKPAYVPISDWFTNTDGDYTSAYLTELASAGERAEALFDQATDEVVRAQIEAGVDIPTDGEIRRENYIHYQCRSMGGIDFDTLTPVRMRGTTDTLLPTVTGPIAPGAFPLAEDYRQAQAAADRFAAEQGSAGVPVKITLPGPMTIIDSTANTFYGEPAELGRDLAAALNLQVRELAAAGCTWIQIDEPLMARKPAEALAWGIDSLGRCFEGVAPKVTRVVHACCGYPNRLDEEDYPKAPQSSYLELAERLNDAPIDAVSLEDAHRHNDLARLLPLFADTAVILGVVAIARSGIEPVDEIRRRLEEAAELAPAGLIAAPDCGLGYLSSDQAVAKLTNLCEAARAL